VGSLVESLVVSLDKLHIGFALLEDLHCPGDSFELGVAPSPSIPLPPGSLVFPTLPENGPRSGYLVEDMSEIVKIEFGLVAH
jgi:hypothetical protein